MFLPTEKCTQALEEAPECCGLRSTGSVLRSFKKDISTSVKFCLSISVLVRGGGPTALNALGLERADGIDRIDLLSLSS